MINLIDLIKLIGSDVVLGYIKPVKPSLIGFKNTVEAIKLLRKHIVNDSTILMHCDVDVDGVGSGYILDRFLRNQGVNKIKYAINKEKEHGIQASHVDHINSEGSIDLLIILDSSSNDIELIRKFKCDVLVVDHHEVLHNNLYIKDDYEYIIVNNMVENLDVDDINKFLMMNNPYTNEKIDKYSVEPDMSGAMVLYELLRVYSEVYSVGNILEKTLLYQWVAVTLFSDFILLKPNRNQWYIQNTLDSKNIEVGLHAILNKLNKYKSKLDKSFILYTLAPTINKAIRAGASRDVLKVIIKYPYNIDSLLEYKEIQNKVLEQALNNVMDIGDSYIIKDITSTDISKNYCGVIASKLCGEHNKNCAVYKVNKEGLCEGSFRGRQVHVDYRKYFDDYSKDVYAQGHRNAFGFKMTKEQLYKVMSMLDDIESENEKSYISIGDIHDKYKGNMHLDNFSRLKKNNNIFRLAKANSRLSSIEHIPIITKSEYLEFMGNRGKLYLYSIDNLSCKAFEEIKTPFCELYVEYTDTVEIYVKNYIAW